jgi:hypothetical protein
MPDDRRDIEMAIELIAAMQAGHDEPCNEGLRAALRLRLLGEDGREVPLREVEKRTGIKKDRVARLAKAVPAAIRTAIERMGRRAA